MFRDSILEHSAKLKAVVQGFHEVPNRKRFLSLTQPLAGAISISNTPMASIQETCQAPSACR